MQGQGVLRAEHELLAPAREELTEEIFTGSVHIVVGAVDEVPTALGEPFEHGAAGGFFGNPGSGLTEGHCAQAQGRHPKAGTPEQLHRHHLVLTRHTHHSLDYGTPASVGNGTGKYCRPWTARLAENSHRVRVCQHGRRLTIATPLASARRRSLGSGPQSEAMPMWAYRPCIASRRCTIGPPPVPCGEPGSAEQ